MCIHLQLKIMWQKFDQTYYILNKLYTDKDNILSLF